LTEIRTNVLSQERITTMRKCASLFSFVSAVIACAGLSVRADGQAVNWQGPSNSRIKQIRYFHKEPAAAQALAAPAPSAAVSGVIDSPPVDGFVPWIVLTPTNKHLDAETTGIYEAFPSSYAGSPPAGTNPRTDFMIAIFDTGASSHVIGYYNAVRAGLYNSTYLTQKNKAEVTGVTGSVEARITWPYALFMAGLDVLEPNAPGQSEMILPSTAGLLGQYNVATLIGQNPGTKPDLATAVGTPMSVFYDTHIEVDHPITITRSQTVYTGPRITFYPKGSPSPAYADYIPLELKPAGSTTVQYITYGFNPEDLLEMFTDPWGFEMDYSPMTPSVVMGVSSQSLFFIHGVDLTDSGRSAVDKNRFMLDTGAQITVIGSRIAARLGLQAAGRDFEVEIEGVTGDSIMAPGFYLDRLTIPAVGQWLEFTNVPVVLLDIFSPEGGTLDGIIGMNLFTQYNLILRAGGFMLEDDPRLEFQRIAAAGQTADIAPLPLDGKVDMQDLAAFSSAWQGSGLTVWNTSADLAPLNAPDGAVDLADLSVLAENWLAGLLY